MKKPRRKSAQREKIYAIIRASAEHPTAKEVYDQLRKESPAAGLGNVYRNIGILLEEGRIVRRDFGDGIEHFDAVTNLHYHFVCESCGRVVDFSLPVQDSITELARRNTRHTVTGHAIQFYGTCEECNIKSADIRGKRGGEKK